MREIKIENVHSDVSVFRSHLKASHPKMLSDKGKKKVIAPISVDNEYR